MKTQFVQMAVFAVVVLGGCVSSLHPVYRDEDLTFDPAILGVWQQEKSAATWEFAKLGEQEYRLTYADKDGRTGRFSAHLAEIEGMRFLDLLPEAKDVEANAFYKFHLLPIHTIYQVKQTTPGLELVSLDLNWLNEYLAQHPEAIEHVTLDGRNVLTAPTEAVQKFVLEHRDKFTGVIRLHREGQPVK